MQYTEEERAKVKKDIIDLLPKKAFHIGKVCKEVRISRKTFYNWKDEDEDFRDAIDEIKEYDIDDSEEKLRLLRQGLPRFNEEGKFVGWIEKPHFGALSLHLEAKGKDRGYGKSLEIRDNRKEELKKFTDEELWEKMKKIGGILNEEDEETEEGK
jgi:hypothetical protein